MPTTLQQVAERCGVSVQTVSRILRGQGHRHKPATVQRVLATARAVGYRPHPMPALGEAHHASARPCVGLIVTGLVNRLPALHFDAIHAAAHSAGYQVLMNVLRTAGPDDEVMAEAVDALLTRGVEGIVIYRSRPVSHELRRRLASLAVPVLFVDWGPPGWRARIKFDVEQATGDAARHLATLGHRRALLLPTRWSFDFPEHTIFPYQRCCARQGIELIADRRWSYEPDPFVGSNLDQIIKRVVSEWSRHEATALLAGNDQTATAALMILQQQGVRVPQDMSVLGSGDWPLANLCSPSLTTVRGPTGDVGTATVSMLKQMIEAPDQPVETIHLQHELIIRESTGPARDADMRSYRADTYPSRGCAEDGNYS